MNSENQCEMKGETLSIQDLNLLFRVHSVIIFLQINEKLKWYTINLEDITLLTGFTDKQERKTT